MTDHDAPPQDRAAERAVLGLILTDKEAVSDVAEILRPEDFYLPAHETVYAVALDLFGDGEPVDLVSVYAGVEARGEHTRVSGEYLHGLVTDTYVVAGQADYYATIVRDKATLRRLADSAQRIRQWAMSADEGDADEVVDRAQAEMMAAVPQRTAEDYRLVRDLLESTLDGIEAAASGATSDRIPTGFYDLDDVLGGGFRPGQMVTVAGRPGLGKSTLAVDFARSASIRHNYCSAVFSLEMSRTEIVHRLLAAEGKVPLSKIISGDLGDEDWRRVAVAMSHLGAAPLFVDDSPHLTMTEIRAKARRLKQRHDLRLIVIDYLQLMTSGKKVENRQTEVSEFSRQIKILAKELQVPVVALSQLNRGPEQRTSKRPMMSDLRESGSIEQDSDVVILLHRDDAYEVESSRPGEADLIVAKNRNGVTRDVAVAAQLHYSRFADLAVS